MTDPDWSAPAKLIERDDGGSEMFFHFEEVGTGTLAELVARVAAMTPQQRARLVIDAGAAGTVNVPQIMDLAARPDFPK